MFSKLVGDLRASVDMHREILLNKTEIRLYSPFSV